MNHDELQFEEFLIARMREKGVSPKRLAEATGIAPVHLENLVHGNFDAMPSTPYFRGYVIRIGKVLDFDGEEWWKRLRGEDFMKNAGPADTLPANRFIKKNVPKAVWIAAVAAVVLIAYLVIMLPRTLGTPTLAITYPSGNPYTTNVNTITIAGTVTGADALYLSNGNASSSEEIPIGGDGSWQKTVLLQSGLNSFELMAKKLLGRETDIVEQVLYEPSASSSATSTATTSPSANF